MGDLAMYAIRVILESAIAFVVFYSIFYPVLAMSELLNLVLGFVGLLNVVGLFVIGAFLNSFRRTVDGLKTEDKLLWDSMSGTEAKHADRLTALEVDAARLNEWRAGHDARHDESNLLIKELRLFVERKFENTDAAIAKQRDHCIACLQQ